MISHHYEVTSKQLLTLTLGPLIPVVLCALILRLGASSGFFPRPQPMWDVDRTVLLHQVAASQSAQNADILLIGDSSCLMDVMAKQLNQLLPRGQRALNLGTLSYLDLTAQAELVRAYTEANPGHVRFLVLLMHPESLRRSGAIPYYAETLKAYQQKADYCSAQDGYGQLSCWLGLEIFRDRFLSAVLPAPLPGSFGQCYGFNWDLWRFMTRNAGSAIDPGQFDLATAKGNAEYRLAPGLEKMSRAFQDALPPDATLLVGITPAPYGFVPADYPGTYQRLLAQWNRWLEADIVLSQLPPSLPDAKFASVTHLNAFGASLFTRMLWQELAPHLAR